MNGAEEETLNNASIVSLEKLDLGDDVIIEKIKSTKCEFDTTISGFPFFATTYRAAIVSCWAPLSWRPWEGNLAV
jgi:hypothetical protein